MGVMKLKLRTRLCFLKIEIRWSLELRCGGCEGDFTSHFTECFLEEVGCSSECFLEPVKGSFERLQSKGQMR